MARKRKEAPPPAGAPAWMNTYGDLVTLLLTFFVLLFSFSTIDAAKWKELVISFSGSPSSISDVGYPPSFMENEGTDAAPPDEIGVPTPTPVPTPKRTMSPEDVALDEEFNHILSQIGEYIDEKDLADFIEVQRISDQIIIRFKDNILFDSGSAEIKRDGIDMLNQILPVLEQSSKAIALIRIEGHTDNLPINTQHFPSNWELSSVRACSVLRYILENSDVDEKLLTASGFAEFWPIATNSNEAGRAKNRRVDVVVDRRRASDMVETFQ